METSRRSPRKNGKLARLPAAIRAEAMLRRAVQRPGQVVEWLNSLPEVKQMLADHFHGFPFTTPNLLHGIRAKPMPRRGKVAHLPPEIREKINEMLLDGRPGKEIVNWVTIVYGVTGSAAITEQNLSKWRNGGYLDWLKKRDYHL